MITRDQYQLFRLAKDSIIDNQKLAEAEMKQVITVSKLLNADHPSLVEDNFKGEASADFYAGMARIAMLYTNFKCQGFSEKQMNAFMMDAGANAMKQWGIKQKEASNG